VDYHIDIEHAAPRSSSEMLYKGILDKKSRAVFNGRLHVEQNAQKILAYQANHNLLLSNEAEVNSKPELEIYADDVKCKHGATTGQLDQDALFYMQARGIQRVDAVNILLKGFSDEILQRVKSAEMKTRIEALVYYS
jgi:Fe-S cluster assembly protein SufD